MKKKILFIAGDPPMPPTGGGTRTFHFLKSLASTNICKLCLLFNLEKKNLPSIILKNCEEIFISSIAFSNAAKSFYIKFLERITHIVFPNLLPTETLILLADYFANHPFVGNNFIKKIFYNWQRNSLIRAANQKYNQGYKIPARTLERYNQFHELEKCIEQNLPNVDILWIDFSYLLIYFKQIKSFNPKLKLICNAHNIEFKYIENLSLVTIDEMQKAWLIRQAQVMKDAELSGFKSCDEILVCSDFDKDYLNKIDPDLRIQVVSNGVDLDFFVPEIIIEPQPIILFTGNMNYHPNKDAVDYFVDFIFPKILKSLPNTIFCIAGLNAENVFPDFLNKDKILLVSSPNDMREYYNKAKIVVVPLRIGSGTRLKILEAAAMKKPIVSTTVGAEGLNFIQNEEILIADEVDMFSDYAIQLLQDSNESNRLVENAFLKVEKEYSWQRIEKIVSNIISKN